MADDTKLALIPIAEVKAGDKLRADGGFTCLNDGQIVEVKQGHGELLVACRHGEHGLDGQINAAGTHYVGFFKAAADAEITPVPETKEFPTLIVLSTITGFTMTEMNSRQFDECACYLLGHPIFTHEHVNRQFSDEISEAARTQYPGLPTEDECRADYRAAAARALADFGPTLEIARGTRIRSLSPEQTMADFCAHYGKPEPIIVVVPDNG